MPLTARRPDGSILDATACSDDDWTGVHKVTPRPLLTCRDCDGRLHAKVSPLGLRFLAHDAHTDTCRLAGETAEHRALKAGIAAAIRAAGGHADVEARPRARDTGGWRADVLATAANGTRIAFEVQLAGLSVADGQTRTAKYTTDGIQTVWVTVKDPHWLYELPSLRVRDTGAGITVMEGAAKLTDRNWTTLRNIPLDTLLRVWLRGEMTTVTGVPLSEERDDGWFHRPQSTVWTSTVHAAAWADVEADRRRVEEADAAAADVRQKAIDALTDRQDDLLQHVVPTIAAKAGPRARVLLGELQMRWNGHLPVEHWMALGEQHTGYGCPIWVDARGHRRLAAVVCPVATQVDADTGARWRTDGVTVYAQTTREAARIARALRWPTSDITVVTTAADQQPAPQPTPQPALF